MNAADAATGFENCQLPYAQLSTALEDGTDTGEDTGRHNPFLPAGKKAGPSNTANARREPPPA